MTPQVWSWPNRTGSTTITYIAPLKKFVMVVDAPGVKPQTPGQSMGVSHLCGLIRRCASLLTSADLIWRWPLTNFDIRSCCRLSAFASGQASSPLPLRC